MDLQDYLRQGYTLDHAKYMTGLTNGSTPAPAVVTTDPRPDLPGKPPGSVPAPRSASKGKSGKSAKTAATTRPASKPAVRTAASRAASAEIRAWAKEAGIPLSPRGRIPANVLERYQASSKH
jgi:hypothetical protein